jgi:Zn-dependent M28 family amino/carboxypeptidase
MQIRIITLALVLAACSVEQERETPSVYAAINEEVLQSSEAYTNLETMTTKIGHRLTGSKNGEMGEQFAFDLLSSYGLETEFFSFKAESWARDSVYVRLVQNTDTLVPKVVTLAHSPVLANVDAELIDAGNGLRADFEALGESVKGKVVIFNIGIYPRDSLLSNLHRSEKTALAREFGAAGVIIVNKVEGGVLLTGTASVTGSLIEIPAVCVGFEDGQRIKEMLANGSMEAHIHCTNTSDMIEARNVIATIPGSTNADEIIALGGHLDSWDLSTGAIDNGVGIAAIIEVARTFAKLKVSPKRTIKFALFMGEEQGLLGSKAWVDDMVESGDIENVRYMINLDMSGNTNGFNIFGRDAMQDFADSIAAIASEIDTTFESRVANRVGLHSDHLPFLLEGIPVMGSVGSLGREVYKFYHSDGDDFSLVNKDHVDRCARFMGMMVFALSTADEIPTAKLTDQATRQFFIDHNLKEELILGNDWKWELDQIDE